MMPAPTVTEPTHPTARAAYGRALEEAREEAGLSRNAFAKLVPPGRQDKDRDSTTVWRWETGRSFPSEDVIAIYLEVSGWTHAKLHHRAGDIVLEGSKRRGPGKDA